MSHGRSTVSCTSGRIYKVIMIVFLSGGKRVLLFFTYPDFRPKTCNRRACQQRGLQRHKNFNCTFTLLPIKMYIRRKKPSVFSNPPFSYSRSLSGAPCPQMHAAINAFKSAHCSSLFLPCATDTSHPERGLKGASLVSKRQECKLVTLAPKSPKMMLVTGPGSFAPSAVYSVFFSKIVKYAKNKN